MFDLLVKNTELFDFKTATNLVSNTVDKINYMFIEQYALIIIAYIYTFV